MYTLWPPEVERRVRVTPPRGVSPVMTTPRSSHDAPDWDALARYRAGESMPDEGAEIAAWLAAHPDEGDLLAVLDGVVAVLLPGERGQPIDIDTALARGKSVV